MGRKTVGIIGNAMTTGPGAPGQRASERYIRAVAGIAGAVPLIIPGMPETQDIGHLIDILDGVVLTGARPRTCIPAATAPSRPRPTSPMTRAATRWRSR